MPPLERFIFLLLYMFAAKLKEDMRDKDRERNRKIEIETGQSGWLEQEKKWVEQAKSGEDRRVKID